MIFSKDSDRARAIGAICQAGEILLVNIQVDVAAASNYCNLVGLFGTGMK